MSLPPLDRLELAVTQADAKSKRAKVFHTKGHARQRLEKYYTPAWCTEALLRHLPVVGHGAVIWEPACGDGGIVTPLREAGYRVVASDIAPDGSFNRSDFFSASHVPTDVGAIVTNPPFGPGGRTAYQFIWHALRLVEPRKGLVAMLLRDDFDSAGGRQELFQHPAFDRKIVLTERIRWTNLEQKAAGPSGSHAWFVWDFKRDTSKPPTLHYAGRK